MECDSYREQISARLDSEDVPDLSASVDRHLDECAACRAWADSAARVTRIARTSVAIATPDVTGAILSDAKVSRGRRVDTVLRVALAMLGAALIVIGISQMDFGGAGDGHHGGTGLAHYVSEFAAWNVALGVGFGWIAVRGRRPAAIVPMLTAFVALLTAFEVVDYLHGSVGLERAASHVPVQLGWVVIMLLAYRGSDDDAWFSRVMHKRRRVSVVESAGGMGSAAIVEPPSITASAHRDAA